LTDRKEKEIILDQIKDQKDSDSFALACSFKPQLNPTSEAIVQSKKFTESGAEFQKKTEDKLYEDAFSRLHKKEELKI